jgi:hypothetical protein
MTPELIRAHLSSRAKPPGSLGRLEDLAAELCRIQRTLMPVARPRDEWCCSPPTTGSLLKEYRCGPRR